ncbi:MAG: metallophosphoesterase [Pirellulales bacterium]|nr:metallophosphoesterase [Pirellulales bacterium]
MSTIIRGFFALLLSAFVLSSLLFCEVAADDLPEVPAGAFNFVAMPDTQQYSESKPEVFHALTQWIVDNLESQQIKFVSHVGDIVDDLEVAQWEVARAAMDRLHGKVPYGISVGNHDMTATDTSMFQQYFPASRFEGFDWYGGNHENNTCSSQLFSAAGKDYLVVHLPCNAPDTALAWADGVLNRYPERKAIVSTHMYLGPIKKPSNSREFYTLPRGRMQWKKRFGEAGNTPQQMWEKCFRNHKNLVLILCGDQSRTQALHQTVRGRHGNTVHEALSDYRDGYLRLYTFMPDNKTIRVTTYSPYLDKICRGTKIAPDAGEHVFTLRPLPKETPAAVGAGVSMAHE